MYYYTYTDIYFIYILYIIFVIIVEIQLVCSSPS